MSYLRDEVLYLVVDGLVGDAPLRTRLAAVGGYLIPRIHNKFEDDFVLKGKLLEIAERLTKIRAGRDDDGDLDATCKRLSDDEAKSIAHDIVAIAFEEINRLAERA